MPRTLQRKFTDTSLTHSMAHHLVATAQLLAECGYARVTDIARRLGLTPGSVSVSMQGLCGSGYVFQDDNRFFHLTEAGAKTVCSVRTRYVVMKQFMVEVLGLGQDEAHEQSCRIAYLLDAATVRRLAGLLFCWGSGEAKASVAEWVPAACSSSECGCNRDDCPCCGLECLSSLLPPLSGTPPCKESSHEN